MDGFVGFRLNSPSSVSQCVGDEKVAMKEFERIKNSGDGYLMANLLKWLLRILKPPLLGSTAPHYGPPATNLSSVLEWAYSGTQFPPPPQHLNLKIPILR